MEIVDLFTQPNIYQLPEKFELFEALGYYKRILSYDLFIFMGLQTLLLLRDKIYKNQRRLCSGKIFVNPRDNPAGENNIMCIRDILLEL